MISYQEIATQIVKKDLKPLYFLYGEEPYLIDKLATLFAERVIPEDEEAFNLTISYGADVTAQDLVADAMRFPMLGERVLVIVKEAQMCKDLEKLLPYLSEFPQSTTLVICYKKPVDKRKAFFKKLIELAVNFESPLIKEYKLVDTIIQMCRSQHFGISPKTAQIMGEHTGTSLEQIATELDKLAIAFPKGKRELTTDDIELYIGISKEYNNFELRQAVVSRDVAKAFKIAKYFSKNESKYPVQAVLPLLFNYFTNLLAVYYLAQRDERTIATTLKISPYQVNDYLLGLQNYSIMATFNIIHQIRMSDALSKGVDGTATSSQVLIDLLSYIFSV